MSPGHSAAVVAIVLGLGGWIAVGSAGMPAARAQESKASGIFHGVGVVKAIDPASGALTIDHGDIKGFMAAMEMMYRVKPRELSAGLHIGDRIAFDIDAKPYTIVGVKVLARAK